MELSISVNVCDLYVILRRNEQIKLVCVKKVCLLILFSVISSTLRFFGYICSHVHQYTGDRIQPVWQWKKCKIEPTKRTKKKDAKSQWHDFIIRTVRLQPAIVELNSLDFYVRHFIPVAQYIHWAHIHKVCNWRFAFFLHFSSLNWTQAFNFLQTIIGGNTSVNYSRDYN